MGSRGLNRFVHNAVQSAAVLDRVSSLFGFSEAVPAGRGRSALALALLASGLPQRAPVLLPANICPSVVASIRYAGMDPVILPVTLETGLPNEAAAMSALRAAKVRGAVLIAHLYGLHCAHHALAREAKQRGWLVIESDTLAVRPFIPTGDRVGADVLIASFGSGKALDAQCGGALLTNDKALARSAQMIVQDWPSLSAADHAIEAHLTLHRRALLGRGLAGLYTASLPQDIDQIPRGTVIDSDGLSDALTRLVDKRENALADWACWTELLRDSIFRPLVQPVSPWRMIAIAPTRELRDRSVALLRSQGFDAGTNYPSVARFFPSLADRDTEDFFGGRVMNLWLADARTARGEHIARLLAGLG